MTGLANAIFESLGLAYFALVLVAVCVAVASALYVAAVEFDAWCQRRWPTPGDE